MSHPAAINTHIWENRYDLITGQRFLINSPEGYWITVEDGHASNRDEAGVFTTEDFDGIENNSGDLDSLTLEVLPPEGSAPAATPEPTGEYQPPYPPAETIINGTAEINAFVEAHPDRHFVVYDRIENTYWIRPEVGIGPNAGGESRNKAGVWLGSEMTTWGFGACEVQMLPLLGSIPPVIEVPLEEQMPGQALFSILSSSVTRSAGESLYPNKTKAVARLREVLKIRHDCDLSRMENGYTDTLGLVILAAMWSGEAEIIGEDYQALKTLVDKAQARLAKAILPATNPTKQQLAQAVAKTYNYE